MENRLREKFGLAGVPLRLSVQKKQKGEGEEAEVAAVRRILDPGEGLKPSRSNEALQTQREDKVKSRPRPKKKEGPKPAAKQAPAKGKYAPPKRVRQKSTKKP
jgi:GTP-binding protein